MDAQYVGLQLADVHGQTGTLIGVFHHGWYFASGQETFMIHDSSYGYLPFGIGVAGFTDQFPYRENLRGSTVLITPSRIRIPDAGISIKWNQTEHPHENGGFSREMRSELLAQAPQLLIAQGNGFLRKLLGYYARSYLPAEAAEERHLRHASGAIVEFIKLLPQGKSAEMTAVLKRMIGFGPGLTPSMDDWLVGFLYVLLRSADCTGAQELCGWLPKLVLELASSRTNQISYTYLSAAARGMYMERLQHAGSSGAREALLRLMKIGSSSGSDMLTGMIFACAYTLEKEISIHMR